MTDDYDEQTKIRGVSSTMNGFVIYGGCVFPILFIGLFGGMGVSDTLCWTMAAGCIGVISIIFGLINYFSIKNVKFIEKAIDQEPENILKTYKDILKLKPMKFFIPWVFFFPVKALASRIAMMSASVPLPRARNSSTVG